MPASGAVGSRPNAANGWAGQPRLRGSRDTAHKVRVLLAHHPQELPAALAPGWAMWDTGARTVEVVARAKWGLSPLAPPGARGAGQASRRSGVMPSSQLCPQGEI